MKRILAALLAAVVVFSPIGNFVSQDQATTVEARGKKSINSNSNSTINNSSVQNKKSDSAAATAKNKGGFLSSGLMKGLMLGGLAGLLFGSLFANMGLLGSLLGLLVNVFAVVILILVIRKLVVFFKNQKEKRVY